jgi:AcrR family transcriptional regulator
LDEDIMTISDRLIAQVMEIAARRNVPLASLSTDQIAAGLGISRSTLYRRIGSREALLQALKDQGVDTGEGPSATDRMLESAAALIREGGLQSLTLEGVAARAEVALPTVFARFGNRIGLLTAVFERHGPVPRIERHLRSLEPGDVAGFRSCIAAILGEIWDLLMHEHALVSAIFIEVLRDPQGDVRAFLAMTYLPQVFEHIFPWLAENVEKGLVRPIPPLILGQELVSPMVMHVATRPLVQSTGITSLPTREEACECFAGLYCAAVLIAGGAEESVHEDV